MARAELKAVAERVARGYGLDIFDVQMRRESSGWVVRVILDRPDPGQPAAPGTHRGTGPPGPIKAESVGIEDCQRVSQDLSAIFDVEEEALGLALPGGYTLEVSSPGLDRPLRHAADFRRFTGRLAKIVVSEAVAGQMHFEGRIEGLDGDTVLLAQGRRMHRIPLALVQRARLEVEF
ncbi:MAG: ribosome maturation factor RimP [Vicinamibacterales bacterium]